MRLGRGPPANAFAAPDASVARRFRHARPLLDVTTPILLLLAWLSAALVQHMGWLWQRRHRNAGIVDVLWAFLLGWAALGCALFADGWAPRRVLVGVLGVGWSLRLGLHLLRRFRSEEEDGRYAQLRSDKGDRIDGWLLVFFQIQALSVGILTLAFAIPAASDVVGWRWSDAAALVIWFGAIVGEGIADRQLAAWRSDEANRGRTCRAGLWRYSRHPNYFFEWLHWFTYPLLALGSAQGWIAWFAPAALLFLMIKVTGIPPTEARAVASRGDDYRRYQQTTNAFFPGPPRKAAQEDMQTDKNEVTP